MEERVPGVVFFAKDSNRFLFGSVAEFLGVDKPDVKGALLSEVLKMFSNNAKLFDDYCPYNIELVGENLVFFVEQIKAGDRAQIDECLATSYRFLCEVVYKHEKDLSGVVKLIHEIRLSGLSFNPEAEMQMRFADYRMPVAIFEKITRSKEVADADAVLAHFKSFPAFKEQTEKLLEDYSGRVEKLKSALDRYETAFNFVGLYDGFESLAKTKRRSVYLSLFLLCVIGFAMILPFVVKLYLSVDSGEYLSEHTSVNVSFLLSVAGLELLLLYFYRVILHNLKSVRGQLVQIDLRRSLCQFIDSYARYASEIRGKDADLLVRFEQLVFSGIVTEAAQIPSTFDGIEQVAKLLEKLKPK
ncbi:hypothetical protein [Pseudomonas tohonis]|uniref:hypothetical protein n=1 Tax=Pseudomonas tohonis TaxID=2725477 RepID=UPI001F2A4632|nr:hypothetical protein [Pseudomonas tohonis]